LKVIVRLDLMEVCITREKFSFWVWVSLLGGFSGYVSGFFRRLTLAVNKIVFMNSVL